MTRLQLPGSQQSTYAGGNGCVRGVTSCGYRGYTMDLALLSCHHERHSGQEGARNILCKVLKQHHFIRVSNNPLGATGIVALMEGLSTQGSGEDENEGWKKIHASRCESGDTGMEAIMSFVAREPTMRAVELDFNGTELRNHLDSIITSINSSHLGHLQLKGNKLLPTSVVALFATLNSPYLHTLDLSDCGLGSEAAQAIATYLESSRSRRLTHLSLTQNQFDHDAIGVILHALEYGNFTLRSLSFHEEPQPRWHPPDRRAIVPVPGPDIAPFLERNESLSKRVTAAALRCLPYARILLNAEPATTSPAKVRYFRLLDLPTEILHVIVRHTSQDAEALSNIEFARLRKEAEGKEGVQRAVQARKACVAARDNRFKHYRDGIEKELADAWAESGDYTRWDRDVYGVRVPL